MNNRLKSFLKGFNNFIKFKRYNYFEKKKYHTKAIALRLKIIPKKIYANFFPIKAVSGSSFTLILHPIFFNKFSISFMKFSSLDFFINI